MIKDIEIIVPYSRNSNLKRGQKYDFKNQSVLITGQNGSGKSSLLHMIAESIHFYRTKPKISLAFETLAPLYSSQVEEEPATVLNPDYFGKLRNERVTYEFLRNADLFGSKVSRAVLENRLRSLKTYNNLEQNVILDEGRKAAEQIIPEYLKWLNKIAKLEKINPEHVYFAALFMSVEEDEEIFSLSDMINPLTDFFYAKINGTKLKEFPLYMSYHIPGEDMTQSQSMLPDKDYLNKVEPIKRGNGSKGEQQMKVLEYILGNAKSDSVILLDEPMANMTENNQDKYTKEIFDKSKEGAQILVASHDRLFNKTARDQGFVEIKL